MIKAWASGIFISIALMACGFQTLFAQDAHINYQSENGMVIVTIDHLNDTVLLNNLLKQVGTSINKTDSLSNLVGKGLTAMGWELVRYNEEVIEFRKTIGDLAAKASTKFFVTDIIELPYVLDVPFGVNDLKKPSVTSLEDKEVMFRYYSDSDVEKVYLSGTFNDWSTTGMPMKRSDDMWRAVVKLPEGKHLYKFIVDGNWITDPHNKLKEVDDHGNANSIYYQYNYIFRLEGMQDAKRVYLAGSFNNWRPRQLEMEKEDGGWELPVYIKNGMHTYKFIVDGNWILDPGNDVKLPDGKGNVNSRLIIGEPFVYTIDHFPDAQQVILAGEFSNWSETELNMRKKNGSWEIPIVLDPGNYQYKFIVDGNWRVDPDNPHQIGSTDQRNSVLVIEPNHTFVLKGHPQAMEVLLTGTFNNWPEDGYTMEKRNGQWEMRVHLPKGKTRYKFIVDGKWIIDPDNPLWELNQYRTKDSILWRD